MPVRQAVIERDGPVCRYCGCLLLLPRKPLTLDHVMPRVRGGPDTVENIVVACVPCNVGKKDRTPEEAGMILFPEGFFAETLAAARLHLAGILVAPEIGSCFNPGCSKEFDRHTTYGAAPAAISRLFCSRTCASDFLWRARAS